MIKGKYLNNHVKNEKPHRNEHCIDGVYVIKKTSHFWNLDHANYMDKMTKLNSSWT